MMKWWIGGAAALLLIVIGSWFIVNRSDDKMVSPVVKERPLNKYTIENLGKRGYKSEIILDDAIATTSAYTVYKFYFDSDEPQSQLTLPLQPGVAQFKYYWFLPTISGTAKSHYGLYPLAS